LVFKLRKLFAKNNIVFILLLLPLCHWTPLRADECQEAIEGFEDPQTQKSQRVNEDLSKLPPVNLDYSDVGKSLESLIKELDEIKPEFQVAKDIERELFEGGDNPYLAEQKAKYLSDGVIDRAKKSLEKFDGANIKDRKLLEGYRILLEKLRRLQESAQQFQQSPRAVVR